MKITFRKGPRYSGLMRLPNTYEIKVDGVEVGCIQEHKEPDRWFWYARGVNTAHHPLSLEECKADVRAFLNSDQKTKVNQNLQKPQ